MNKKSIIATCISVVFSSGIASASDTFDSICNTILQNNPALAALKSTTDADILNLKSEKNLNDPEVEFEHQWGQGNIGNKWSISVSQSFDWPGVYKRRSEASRAAESALSMLYKSEVDNLRLRAAQTLIDYIHAFRTREMAYAVKNNLDSIYTSVSKAYEHGEATIIDMKKISFERAEAISRCDEAQLSVDNFRYEIIALNGGKYLDLTFLKDYPAYKLETENYYLEKSFNADPAYRAAIRHSEAAKLNTTAVRMKSMPGFYLGYIHNVEIGEHFNGIKAGITLPFFSNRHRSSASAAEYLATQFKCDDYVQNMTSRIKSDYSAIKAYRTRINNYNEIFPDDGSDNYLELLQKSYYGGQMTFITYLYEINYYIEARTSYLNLLHSYYLTMASLNRFEE